MVVKAVNTWDTFKLADLPNIDDLLEQMAGYRMYTVLDLAKSDLLGSLFPHFLHIRFLPFLSSKVYYGPLPHVLPAYFAPATILQKLRQDIAERQAKW